MDACLSVVFLTSVVPTDIGTKDEAEDEAKRVFCNTGS